MKSTFNSLVTILTISAATFAATSSEACGGKKGGGNGGGFGGGYKVGGVGIRVGGGYGGGSYNKNNNGGHCNTNGGYPSGGYPSGGYPTGGNPYDPNYGQAYEPFHSAYVCQPGDVFYSVSLKEYGTSAVANHIARFNRLQPNAALVPGQRLMLPSVSANGQLTQSRAPMPFVDGGVPNSVGTPTAKFTPNSVPSTLAANVTTAPSEPALPKVAVGSTLVLDGQEFGTEQGVARLRVNGLSLPIEVIEWTNDSATVRLPKVELAAALKAEIEVLRADGSVASKTGIELSPAAETLALGN